MVPVWGEGEETTPPNDDDPPDDDPPDDDPPTCPDCGNTPCCGECCEKTTCSGGGGCGGAGSHTTYKCHTGKKCFGESSSDTFEIDLEAELLIEVGAIVKRKVTNYWDECREVKGCTKCSWAYSGSAVKREVKWDIKIEMLAVYKHDHTTQEKGRNECTTAAI